MNILQQIINEEIISNQDRFKKTYYNDREYNNGEREIIDLPTNFAKDFLRSKEYEFKTLNMTSDSNTEVYLFYNGQDFAMVIMYYNKTYNAPLEKDTYLALKEKYEKNTIPR